MSSPESQQVTALIDQISAMVRDHGPGVQVSAGDLEVLTNMAALGVCYLNVRHTEDGPDHMDANDRLELVHAHMLGKAFGNHVDDKRKVGLALAAVALQAIVDRHHARLWWSTKGGPHAIG